MELQTNPELELASDFVRNTNKHVFLTGKAGSGKTTFLHQLKAARLKRMAIVAPTGVAAINAGGMTIHSLFQIPIGLHVPGAERNNEHRAYRAEKIRLIRSLDLLVIDEISMVRADLLDAVDQSLQRIRNQRQPFGGVQLLMIGDLHQLPPVVKNEEWEILKPYYKTPYFFDSQALQQTDYITIELKHIYRQADPVFIGLLNKVRDNQIDAVVLQKLNTRYVPNYRPATAEPSITLTATNASAQQINQQNMQRLPGKIHSCRATVLGDFPASSYPTDEILELKVGAQVMFIRNDTQSQRYFNGKLGQVSRVGTDGEIWVQCPDQAHEMLVSPVEWQNTKYALNEETKKIEENVVGTFIQYPLKLAWAITIHKSQGLTFDRCVIDAQTAFASGQVYVALSRCKTLEGIVLQTPIPASSIKTDRVVQEFSQEAEKNYPTQAQLDEAKRQYQADAVRTLFEFGGVSRNAQRLVRLAQESSNTVLPETIEQLNGWMLRVQTELVQVSEKFAPQLAQYLQSENLPESNEELQTRMRKAAIYFLEKLKALLQDTQNWSLITDNKEVAEGMLTNMQQWRSSLFVKQCCFETCQARFSAEELQRAIVNAELDFQKLVAKPGARPIQVPKGLPNPELYKQLSQWRQSIAQGQKRPEFDILPNTAIRELSVYMPSNKVEMLKIAGIGKGRFEKYGKELLDLIQEYRTKNAVKGAALPILEKLPRGVSETKRLSYQMWKAGDSPEQIAGKRSLSVSTVIGHLADFVERGEIAVERLSAAERVAEVLVFLQANPTATSADARTHFAGKYDYPELRLIIAHSRWLAAQDINRDNAHISDGAP
ncbi:MAG: AAA family ATPase [Planctomycetaceae bacterium]|nr:AAA family ATPase [Planctomycetaceae bacterium]